MMRNRLITFACLLALPTVATAQYEGSRMSTSTTRMLGEKEGWDTLITFGSCYASSQRSKAYRFVATEPGTADEARTYKALFSKSDEPCLGDVSEMSVNYQFVRGAIAEGLYLKGVPVPANLAAQPIPRERVQSVLQTAICYAGQNAAEARWLIENTSPSSSKEDEAIKRLTPRFAACLPPNLPQSFSIDPTLLRFRIAEAMWRLGMVRGQADATAPAAPPARTPKSGEERGD
jgi:hypothetical protein